MNNDPKHIYHLRADHEDNLHNARTSIFISLNGFIAVSVGLVDDLVIKIVFVIIVLTIDFVWGAWAPDGQKYIHALRDAGCDRCDQKLWQKVIGESETRRWPKGKILKIISVGLPLFLSACWVFILIYLLLILTCRIIVFDDSCQTFWRYFSPPATIQI